MLTDPANWPLGAPFAVCVALVALYASGGRGRGGDRGRAAAFYGGIATIVLALDTPIDAYADRLFVIHMVQHVLLLTVAPPLLVLGQAWPRLWRPFPVAVKRAAARVFVVGAPLTLPPVALLLLAANLAMWHVPALYDATLRNNLVHQLEHLTFVVTGLLFWAPMLGAPPLRARLDGAYRCLYLVLAIVPGWILAIVLAFARTPLYSYARPGLAPLSDQQLAAGVMWVPGSLVYLVAACWSLYAWLDPAGAKRPHRPAVPSPSPSP